MCLEVRTISAVIPQALSMMLVEAESLPLSRFSLFFCLFCCAEVFQFEANICFSFQDLGVVAYHILVYLPLICSSSGSQFGDLGFSV